MRLLRAFHAILLFGLVSGCTSHPRIEATKLADIPQAPKRILLISSLDRLASSYRPFHDAFQQTMQRCGVAVEISEIDPLALNDDAQKSLIARFDPDMLLEFQLAYATFDGARCDSTFSAKAIAPRQHQMLWTARITQTSSCLEIESLQAQAQDLARKLHEDGLLPSCPSLANRDESRP